MGKNLIIRQGARTTRLGVREGAVLIGRDADCDLSLEDQTISRHHARLDVATNGVKLVDLNSSNGCWVNDERVSERVLEPGDVIRLGTIRMTIEDSPAGRPKASEPVQDEDAWLFFSVSPGPSMGSGVVSGTEDTLPFLPASSLGLQPDALPPLQPPQAVSHRAPDPPARVPEKRLNWLDEAARRTAAWSWSTKIGLTLTLLGLLAYAGVAWPLVKALRRSSTEDFLRRGHALARYLAAENEHLLAEGRLQELSVEGLSREPGVKEALILGLDGKVLAPSGY
ncbi:MAG: FHA domain-containing protein, partial [Vicinamibacteria bacterium]